MAQGSHPMAAVTRLPAAAKNQPQTRPQNMLNPGRSRGRHPFVQAGSVPRLPAVMPGGVGEVAGAPLRDVGLPAVATQGEWDGEAQDWAARKRFLKYRGRRKSLLPRRQTSRNLPQLLFLGRDLRSDSKMRKGGKKPMDSEGGLAPSTARDGAEQRQGEQVAPTGALAQERSPRVVPSPVPVPQGLGQASRIWSFLPRWRGSPRHSPAGTSHSPRPRGKQTHGGVGAGRCHHCRAASAW